MLAMKSIDSDLRDQSEISNVFLIFLKGLWYFTSVSGKPGNWQHKWGFLSRKISKSLRKSDKWKIFRTKSEQFWRRKARIPIESHKKNVGVYQKNCSILKRIFVVHTAIISFKKFNNLWMTVGVCRNSSSKKCNFDRRVHSMFIFQKNAISQNFKILLLY